MPVLVLLLALPALSESTEEALPCLAGCGTGSALLWQVVNQLQWRRKTEGAVPPLSWGGSCDLDTANNLFFILSNELENWRRGKKKASAEEFQQGQGRGRKTEDTFEEKVLQMRRNSLFCNACNVSFDQKAKLKSSPLANLQNQVNYSLPSSP